VSSQDSFVYAQALRTMTPPRAASTGSEWSLAVGGKVKAITIKGNDIYAVRENKRVYRQLLSAASPLEDGWQLASAAAVEAIEIDEDIIYGVGIDRCIWKQYLDEMTVNSTWILASAPAVVAIAVHAAGDMMYGVGVDMSVYRQPLSTMNTKTRWLAASKGSVERIAIYGDTMYGVAYDKRIWKQTLSTMTTDTEWSVASRDSVEDIAFSGYGFHPVGTGEGARGGTLPIEFINGDVLREVDGLEDATVIYLSSLFFDSALLMGLAWAMSATLRPGTLIFSEKSFPGCWPGLLRLQTLRVPTAWSRELDVAAYIVAPAPLVPQPAWLTSGGPAVDEFLKALGGSWEAVGSTVNRSLWVDAAKRAWPGSEELMLWRLATAAAASRGIALPEEGLPVEVARAAVEERLGGGSDGSAVECAWSTLENVARLSLAALAARGNASESPTTSAGELTLATVLPRLVEVGKTDSLGRTLMSVVAGSLDEKLALHVLESLLQSKVPIDVPDSAGISPMGHASRRGHAAVARLLLDARAGLQPSPAPAGSVGAAGRTSALHLAALHGHLAVAELLVARGAALDATDEDGRVPWQVAPRLHVNLTRLLSGGGAVA